MLTMINRIIHGAHHMPASAALLRTATLLFGVFVASYTLAESAPTWMAALAAIIVLVSAFLSCMEMYEAAVSCEKHTDDEDNDQTGFGEAA
ncbi:hypothetical protein GCM10007147_18560 [Nocardiopsis kunsanensis]|uniref:Uncharacterized protein n=1 Tax=Nocardiopsis kunsanensis TaxID=141693 RepID=A0A919CGR8_9ACTN|nr:hypothetical protein [Nocardiopsis kunsanensis]GHD23390.1 hypothetical protein GCM10007147_18560 [Nocardiopsis kunsanensis]